LSSTLESSAHPLAHPPPVSGIELGQGGAGVAEHQQQREALATAPRIGARA
jgi:hypothetical protein